MIRQRGNCLPTTTVFLSFNQHLNTQAHLRRDCARHTVVGIGRLTTIRVLDFELFHFRELDGGGMKGGEGWWEG